MNKTELIEVVSKQMGDRRTASTAVESVVDAITRAVASGQKVSITGFGVFEKVDRAARTARNPATGASVKLKKTSMPKFRPGQGFKDIVSGAKKVSPSSSGRAVTARAGRAASATAAKAGASGSATKAAAKGSARAAASTAKATASSARSAVDTARSTAARAVAPTPKTKKAPANKAPSKATAKTPAKKTPAKKAPAQPTSKAPASTSPAKKTAARKTAAKASPAKKASAKKS